jgi:hypothetical protein
LEDNLDVFAAKHLLEKSMGLGLEEADAEGLGLREGEDGHLHESV